MSEKPPLSFRNLVHGGPEFQALVRAQRADLITHGYTDREAEAMNTSGQFRASWLTRRPRSHQAIAGIVDDEIVGWIHLIFMPESVALLESLFVHTKKRGNGYARRLVREAVVRASHAHIETLEVYALDRDKGNDALWQHLLNAPAPNAVGDLILFTAPPVYLKARGWHLPISRIHV